VTKTVQAVDTIGKNGLEKAKQITSASDHRAEAEAVVSAFGGKIGNKVGAVFENENGKQFANRINSLAKDDYAGLIKIVYDAVNWAKKEGVDAKILDV
jgi:hypothetical protein